ncbi:MAG TPA: nitrous oxide reductase accessory protein NosL [Anaerolineae bacterium]
MKSWLTILLLLVGAILLAGCRSGANLEEPPEIRYGEDVCDHCNMIISEPRFAAAYVTPQGEVRRFDDIGDMVAYHQERGEQVHVFWVHDYATEEWLKAENAFFVVSEDLITPMGSGIVATAGQDEADKVVARWSGQVLTFDALLAQAQAGRITEHHHHGSAMPHGHGG